jgi:hypothetical protein
MKGVALVGDAISTLACNHEDASDDAGDLAQ